MMVKMHLNIATTEYNYMPMILKIYKSIAIMFETINTIQFPSSLETICRSTKQEMVPPTFQTSK